MSEAQKSSFNRGNYQATSQNRFALQIRSFVVVIVTNNRADGSISLDLLWKLLPRSSRNNYHSIEDLKKVIQPGSPKTATVLTGTAKHTKTTRGKARRLIASVLQTKENIEMACDDIFRTAISDGVTCNTVATLNDNNRYGVDGPSNCTYSKVRKIKVELTGKGFGIGRNCLYRFVQEERD